MKRFSINVKKGISILAAAALIITGMPQAASGIVTAWAGDVTSSSNSYDFTSNAGKAAPVVGEVLDGTGIVYQDKGTSSGCTFDANQLRFRPGVVLYLPLKDDTTKVTYTAVASDNKADRLTYVGDKDSAYKVAMSNTGESVTIPDISNYIVTVGEKKYLPIISGGDIKIKSISLTEYNPVNVVTVSGTIAEAAKYGVDSITFKNLDDESAPTVSATVNADGTYSAQLKRIDGNTNYVASINTTGAQIDDANGANLFTLTGNDATATKDFSLKTAAVATISGKITGITDDLIKGEVSASLVPSSSVYNTIELTLVKSGDDYRFSDVTVKPSVTYKVVLKNCDDFEVESGICVGEGVYTGIPIKATLKSLYDVTGKFVTSDGKSASVSSVTFTNMETPDYSYTGTVSGDSYTVKLRAGEYETSAVVDGYTVYDHVSVKDAALSNDIYLAAPQDTSAVAYKDTVKVGAGQEFETIAKAVAYISRMTRDNGERVTIVLTDDLYREQLIIDTPNITVKSEKESGSTITWYYGVGYSYYSAKPSTDGKTGCYYDEAYAVDKYYKGTISQNPGHWGSTVNLFAGAKGFKAEGITFENSLNRYMTDEEKADGVGTNVTLGVTDRSTATSADVLKRAAKERAAVIYIQADDTEYKDCNFLSSQDTVYTGDDNESSYFVNCKIEGTTDYICGDGNPVFDQCTLSMYSYSDMESTKAYIVASKAKGTFGYLFNNCKIVTTTDAGLKATYDNYLARAWDAGIINYINTEVESANMIIAEGYTDMNAKVENAHYYEYNTHTPDGTVVDMSKRAKGVTILTDEQAKAISIPTYLDGFYATYYYADYTAVDEAVKAAGELVASDYEDFTGVEAAVNEVNKTLSKANQDKVDAMAKAINDAIAALVKKQEPPKTADFTAVDEAIKAAGKLVASDYEDFTGVQTAIAAVDRTCTDQAKVDAMAKAINDAIAALVKKPEETKPEETKPEETKPEETKPEETKPEETTPAETKPEETTPAETKPEETTSSEASSETQPADDNNTSAETGDASNAGMFGMAALLAMGVVAIAYWDKKRKTVK